MSGCDESRTIPRARVRRTEGRGACMRVAKSSYLRGTSYEYSPTVAFSEARTFYCSNVEYRDRPNENVGESHQIPIASQGFVFRVIRVNNAKRKERPVDLIGAAFKRCSVDPCNA